MPPSLQLLVQLIEQDVGKQRRERRPLRGPLLDRKSTQAKLANFLSQVEYYGLGLDYPEKYPSLIRSITREEILRIAKKYLDPQQYVLVIVANLKEAGLE